MASLRSVSNTLTDLELDMEGGPALDILDVMMACPNLISLSICHIRRVNVISQPMTTWPALTKLSVKYPDNAIACDQIIGIWKRFPSLKKLELDTCTDISSTFIVPDYRPSMKSLELKMSFTGPELTYTDKGDHNDEPGLTKLIIEPLDLEPGETCKDTSSIIKRYHNTLEHLEWDMDTSQDTENIEDIHYPRLKKLALCWSGWQIPRNAPLIEDLTLSSRIIQPHPEVLDTIQPHLRKLELDLEGVPQVVHKSSILLYLSRVALRCQLKELVLRLNSTDHFIDILNAIYRHAHLECLKISFTRDWDYDGMERFFDGLVKRCPRLSCLELRCPNAPSIQSLNTLKRHTHLQQVAFSIRGTDNWDYFWDTLRTFSQLKRIRMYPWSKALEDKVNYLKRQRPDLKIIYSRYGSSHF